MEVRREWEIEGKRERMPAYGDIFAVEMEKNGKLIALLFRGFAKSKGHNLFFA